MDGKNRADTVRNGRFGQGGGTSECRSFRSLDEALREISGGERGSRVVEWRRVFGGDINEAFRLTLEDGHRLFMKRNRREALPSFVSEAEGLRAIAGTDAIGTPTVLAVGTDPDGHAFLLQEFLEPGQKVQDYWERLGAELWAMHSAGRRTENDAAVTEEAVGQPAPGGLTRAAVPGPEPKIFGFPSDIFIGATAQKNTWKASWIDFFRSCRLEPQLRMAGAYLDAQDRSCAAGLLEKLDSYLEEPEAPALLHGDLWGGNVMTGPDGRAWLIDPAVYYGHPEADLAMTELFGGFAPAFYRTYAECAKLSPDYRDRRDLYNLYHLLNHLNLFGAGYLSEVRGLLRRYG